MRSSQPLQLSLSGTRTALCALLALSCSSDSPSATGTGTTTGSNSPAERAGAMENGASPDPVVSNEGSAADSSEPPADSSNEGNPNVSTNATGEEGTEGSTSPEDPNRTPPTGFYVMEDLDRGIVALPKDGGIYVGWRMFGYEYNRDNPEAVSFNVYRDGNLLASVTDSTNFLDESGTPESAYSVSVVLDGVESAQSAPTLPWSQQFLRVPLDPPGANYSAHDASLGDVDGDGEFEIFMIWQPSNARDNSQSGDTDDVFLDALKLDGTALWRINLGPNIRAGEHYTQFIVIDADGDGRAELGVKTAPGTRDASGEFLKLGPAANDDDSAVFRNGEGYVLDGPEYFSVFSGLTGLELATAAYHVPRGNVNSWGDGYGNRVDRFLAAAAYVDDTGLPSFIMARGYYTRTTLGAWNWRDGELTQLWVFDSDQEPQDSEGRTYTGQGAHSLSVANVDDDPQQEIIYGAITIDHDGTGKCSTAMNHGDALHVSDFMPDRPGIEVFMPTESENRPHWTIRDGNTCEILRESTNEGSDVGRGVAADVVASNPGAEFWASSGVRLSSFNDGTEVNGPQPNSVNFLVWWDADELRELENGTSIVKVGEGTLLNCNQCASNNGTKSVPSLVADVFGDWREEVIWREADNSALRIYTTTDVTSRRIYTLMHDPQYRSAISWQNVAYNQPPHPGFFIGGDMPSPPTPDIRLATPPNP